MPDYIDIVINQTPIYIDVSKQQPIYIEIVFSSGGGSSSSNVDGGNASSIYLIAQNIDGGNA